MFGTITRTTVAISLLVGVALPGGFAVARPPAEVHSTASATASGSNAADADEAGVAREREELADLLASERVERIDFMAETYDQAMRNIYLTVDTIFELSGTGVTDGNVVVDRASQVIEALDSQTPRGLAVTFGKNAKALGVRNGGDARMLGELVAGTVNIIREQLGEDNTLYRDHAKQLFRSVILDPEEGSYLTQYLEGIQRIAEQPAEKRRRHFR